MASSPVTSQADMIDAPTQLTRPGARTGDSGTKRNVVTIAPSDRIKGIQNNQWYERCSTIGPESTIPAPTPTPRMAESIPIAPATFLGGNSSRMIPKARGKTVSYTHLRAHETGRNLVCRLLLEK